MNKSRIVCLEAAMVFYNLSHPYCEHCKRPFEEAKNITLAELDGTGGIRSVSIPKAGALNTRGQIDMFQERTLEPAIRALLHEMPKDIVMFNLAGKEIFRSFEFETMETCTYKNISIGYGENSESKNGYLFICFKEVK